MIVAQNAEALWDARFIDRDFYTSEELFEQEKELIFRKSWILAGFSQEIPKSGDYLSLTIAGQPVVVVRGTDGEIRAFHNACTHRAATLTGERCGNAGRMFKCPYHAWSFNFEGELIGVPYPEAYGPEFDRSKHGLAPIRCDVFENLIFVCLDPAGPALAEFLGEMAPFLAPYMQGIEPIGRATWVYPGNWKLWNENARDNYHPEFAHKAFHEMIPHFADRGGCWALAPGHSRIRWVAEAPNMKAYYRALTRASGIEFAEEEQGVVDYPADTPQEVLAIFPSMDVQPGALGEGEAGGWRAMRTGYIQVVTPISVTKSRVDLIVYSSTEDTEEERKGALENLAAGQGTWGMIACDDTEAANRCQMGMYTGGQRYSIAARGIKPGTGGLTPDVCSRDEYSMREFYRVYKAMLGINKSAAETAAA